MGPDGAEERSMKQEGRGAEHNLSKNDIAPENNVNRLKSIGSNQQTSIANLKAKRHTQRWQNSPKALSAEGGVGGSPVAGMILPLISI